jgi:hypothetical protein
MKLQKQLSALMEDKARLEEECSVQLSPEEMQAKLMAKVCDEIRVCGIGGHGFSPRCLSWMAWCARIECCSSLPAPTHLN